MGAGNGTGDTETTSQVGCKGLKGVPSMSVMGTFRGRARHFAAEERITLVADVGLLAATAMWLVNCRRRNAVPTALPQRTRGG
jgi:hypothetical protein